MSENSVLNVIPVILAGGSGTRLWPLSRKMYPKQFLPLVGANTLFQETLLRLRGAVTTAPIVICNQEHRFLAAEQLHQIGIDDATIILEREGRNTASAIAVAALKAQEEEENPLLLILSADHSIQDKAVFHDAIKRASLPALKGDIVVFGVPPTTPHTGYGYIKASEQPGEAVYCEGAKRIEKFTEKPDRSTAEKYLGEGGYLWNSGMFLFKAKEFLTELKKFHPEIQSASQEALDKGNVDLDFYRLASYPSNLESLSIDYAIMEKTERGVVVPLNARWCDVGGWSALYELGEKDEERNCIKGDVLTEKTTGCYIHSKDHLVTAIGVDDLCIIHTPDVTLVANKNDSERVKKLVGQLQQQSLDEALDHRKVYRPWGWYDTVDSGDCFKVKRICVNPGASLSLQKHKHRSEHWVVVKGKAKITNGDQTQLLSENQSSYIPIGAAHRLENPGESPLQIIEVQSGDYLGEDDIVRLQDEYGR
ncbi:MAG TPA: mannose-1-phosphate guanylyltransferase/mannose-6-phosphate isomerase [Deltaproteobacteria bacterium]|jgi:mannose-1-phosphate guanylyltransferase|nr:mannose-1-phosphate guanylyltransferase/mannose-6-phosphate isomerase [Deltaproteobacteria bacterium]|tara:strand:+ start:175 stop:1611 length:1437 start_codon:yes stop_codon:yes gene_type:complete